MEPTLVYDDDCGFCTWWAEWLGRHSTLRIVGFSELDDEPRLRERLPADFEDCSHLLTDDRVYSCGASIEEAVARSDLGPVARPAVDGLRRVGPYRSLREWGYSQVAHNRGHLGRVLSRPPPARREREREPDDDG